MHRQNLVSLVAVLIPLTLGAPIVQGLHGGHHFGGESAPDCNYNNSACASGHATMSFETGCGPPPEPAENYVCLGLSGTAEGHSGTIGPPQGAQSSSSQNAPSLVAGRLEAGLKGMDNGGCEWTTGGGGCVHVFMDGMETTHKAWHRTDGTKQIHGGGAEARPLPACETPGHNPDCDLAEATFSAWYQFS